MAFKDECSPFITLGDLAISVRAFTQSTAGSVLVPLSFSSILDSQAIAHCDHVCGIIGEFSVLYPPMGNTLLQVLARLMSWIIGMIGTLLPGIHSRQDSNLFLAQDGAISYVYSHFRTCPLYDLIPRRAIAGECGQIILTAYAEAGTTTA